MPSSGWIGPAPHSPKRSAPPKAEQINGVRRVVPEQAIGPRPCLALRVHVLAAEETGLEVHLLNGELARDDPVVNVVMARIEAPGVAHHADQAGFPLFGEHRFRIGEAVGERDFDLDVLAGVHALDRLGGVHLGGVHRITASTSCRSGSARSVQACAMPYLAAICRVSSSRRPTRLTTSTPAMFFRPSRCFSPKAPAPARAILMLGSP
jgi:hypothetical protein